MPDQHVLGGWWDTIGPLPAQHTNPWPWPKPSDKPSDMAPSCEIHDSTMRWAAKHRASKGHWHCDECAKGDRR